jgi:hypothetical protein
VKWQGAVARTILEEKESAVLKAEILVRASACVHSSICAKIYTQIKKSE